MRKKNVLLFSGIILLILLNLFVGIWVFTDWFDTPDTPTSKTVELSAEQARREILVLYPGAGEGQVGYQYSQHSSKSRMGPECFAVVDGKVYVLDNVNQRIICFAQGKYSEIKIPENTGFMQYADGQFYLVTTESKPLQFYVYDLDGTEKFSVSLPEVISGVNKILKLDGTSIEFDGNSQVGQSTIKFEWETQKYSRKSSAPSLEHRIDMAVRTEAAGYWVIAEVDDDLFYECYDIEEWNLYVNRQSADGSRWFVELEKESRHSTPEQKYYLDVHGRLYVMECFDDRTVISELVLREEQ